MTVLDFLIIGGGIHGTYISNLLSKSKKISQDKMRVLDPQEIPLFRWTEFTKNTGMDFLRSPDIHNLDIDPKSLKNYSKSQLGKVYAKFLGFYERPSLTLFQKHSQYVIEKNNLDKIRLKAVAEKLVVMPSGVKVETSQGSLLARRILLAIGLGDQPFFPKWAEEIRRDNVPLYHIFEPGFKRENIKNWSKCVIIGGGISALQLALTLSKEKEKSVLLLARNSLRRHEFDSDPGWIGPKFMNKFYSTKSPIERRKIIAKARNKGSVPENVFRELKNAVDRSLLSFQIGEVTKAEKAIDGSLKLSLANDQDFLISDCVILATGFENKRPGGKFLDNAIEDFSLPCALCGYPIVDPVLRWNKNIYVSGPLAELEVGPTSRNIIGVRLAGRKIISSL